MLSWVLVCRKQLPKTGPTLRCVFSALAGSLRYMYAYSNKSCVPSLELDSGLELSGKNPLKGNEPPAAGAVPE